VNEGLTNPYAGCRGSWVRGSIHGHCREHSGCATVPLATSIALYHAAGARFVAVTDHDHVTDLAAFRRSYPDMAFLEGFEYSRSENVLFVGERVPPFHQLPIQQAMRAANGLLTVICHPRPSRSREYWTVEMIMALDPPPVGIEVYNGHYKGPHGIFRDPNPLYTDTWDALLDRGLCVWGFANDDFHDRQDFGRAWNMVNVEEMSAAALLSAMRAGRSYGTTGLLLDHIAVEDRRIHVQLAENATGRFVGSGGRILAESDGREFSYAAAHEPRVRFEAEGRAGRIFLQPVFYGP
jgi:hypothetical protein